MQTVATFQKTLEKSNQWIEEVMEELDLESPQLAYRMLRAVLHALRDHLTLQETADLASQLPMLIRGFYYEGWKPAGKLHKEHQELEFLRRVSENFSKEPELIIFEDCENIAMAVFRVLSRHVSLGEIQDVKAVLPRELRQLWS